MHCTAVSVLAKRCSLIFLLYSLSSSAAKRLYIPLALRYLKHFLLSEYLSRRLWDQKLYTNYKRQADTSVKPAGLKTLVPLILIDYVWYKLVYSYSDHSTDCCRETCSVVLKTFRRDLGNETPGCCSICLQANV